MKATAVAKQLYQELNNIPGVTVNARFDAAAVGKDRPFATPVELWQQNPRLQLAMRVRGIGEAEITGVAADYEKLVALLGVLTHTAGSTLAADLTADLAWLTAPLAPAPQNAAEIWQAACTHLFAGNVTPRTLLARERAALVCVSVCDARAREVLGGNLLPLPSLDRLADITAPEFAISAQTVGKSCNIAVNDLASLEAALQQTVAALAAAGAVAVSIDLSGFSRFKRPDPYHAGQLLAAAMAGQGATLTSEDRALWQAQLLRAVGRSLAAHGMRLVVQTTPKTEHVWGDFSALAFRSLLTYLAGEGALVKTLLTLAAGELPAGLSVLLDRFFDGAGKPLLYFGIAGAGAATPELSCSLRYYLRRGAAPLLLGITDDERGFFTAPAKARFCRVLSAELARFAENGAHCTANGIDFAGIDQLFSLAKDIAAENAARFFGLV